MPVPGHVEETYEVVDGRRADGVHKSRTDFYKEDEYQYIRHDSDAAGYTAVGGALVMLAWCFCSSNE